MFSSYTRFLLLILLTLEAVSAARGQPVDGVGDPLPQRAVARLGSSRLRHGGQMHDLMFSPDGKRLASWGGRYRVSEGVAIWDAATGTELRRAQHPGAWLSTWAWLPGGRLTAVVRSLASDEYSFFELSAAKVYGQPFPKTDRGQDRRFAISPVGDLLAMSNSGSDGRGYTIEFRDLNSDHPVEQPKVWRVAQGTLPYTTILRFTPDGRTLIALTPSNGFPQRTGWTAVLWNAETATERKRLTLPDSLFSNPSRQTVDVSNEQLAAGFQDGSVILYELTTGKEEKLPEGHKPEDPREFRSAGGVAAVRFTRDGKTLVTVGGDHLVREWNIAERKKSREFRWSKTLTELADISPDGKVLALGGREGVVRLLNASTGAEICPQPGHERGVRFVALSADSRFAATTGYDQTIRIWDLEKSREARVITCHGFMKDCALAPDGKTVLAGVNPGQNPEEAILHIWNAQSGEELRPVGLTGTSAESVRFAPDGRTLLTLSGDTVTSWDWPQGKRLREITIPKGQEKGFRTLGAILAISPDGELLLTMCRHVNWAWGQAIDAAGGSLDLWEIKSGKHLQQLAGSDGLTERAAFTGTGELVITSDSPLWNSDDHRESAPGVLHVLDTPTRRLKRMFPVPALVTALAVSPDGKTAYLGSPDGTIHAYQIGSGRSGFSLAGHHDSVAALAIGAGGQRLVSASGDTSALIWDISIAWH